MTNVKDFLNTVSSSLFVGDYRIAKRDDRGYIYLRGPKWGEKLSGEIEKKYNALLKAMQTHVTKIEYDGELYWLVKNGISIRVFADHFYMITPTGYIKEPNSKGQYI